MAKKDGMNKGLKINLIVVGVIVGLVVIGIFLGSFLFASPNTNNSKLENDYPVLKNYGFKNSYFSTYPGQLNDTTNFIEISNSSGDINYLNASFAIANKIPYKNSSVYHYNEYKLGHNFSVPPYVSTEQLNEYAKEYGMGPGNTGKVIYLNVSCVGNPTCIYDFRDRDTDFADIECGGKVSPAIVYRYGDCHGGWLQGYCNVKISVIDCEAVYWIFGWDDNKNISEGLYGPFIK
jgi:hypothetical protein